MTFLNKQPDWESILVRVATRKSLVRHVKERIMLLGFHCITNLLPLSFGRVNAGRVVCASVQQDDASFWGRFDIRNHAVEI